MAQNEAPIFFIWTSSFQTDSSFHPNCTGFKEIGKRKQNMAVKVDTNSFKQENRNVVQIQNCSSLYGQLLTKKMVMGIDC